MGEGTSQCNSKRANIQVSLSRAFSILSPQRSITSAVTGGLISSWVPELDGAKTSCVVKIVGLAQVISLRVPHAKQPLFLHHIHKTGGSNPCLSWKLRSAGDSHVIVLLFGGAGVSLFLTHHLELTPEKYIFVVTFQVPLCPLTPFPLLLCPCTCSS